MTLFTYKARDAAGQLITGRIEARVATDVAGQLILRKLTPVAINEARIDADVIEQLSNFFAPKPTIDEMMLHARQMYAITRSGVPLTRGMTSLAASTRNALLQKALVEIVVKLESGRNLSSCMEDYPRVFSLLFISIIRVGEETGHLEDAYLRIYEYLSFERDTLTRIKTALRYPTIVLVAVVIAVVILMIFVVPQFAGIFERFKAELPLPTRMVVATSKFMVESWWVMLLGMAGMYYAFRTWIRTTAGRWQWDRYKFSWPIVGSILHRATLARFSRAFALTFSSGVPLVQSLKMIEQLVNNQYMARAVARIRDGVENGETLHSSAASTQMFTPLVLQMLAVGEETGRVDEMLKEVAEFYEREVEYDVENLGATIEPLLTVAVGCVVLLLALAVFLPIWDLSTVVSGGH